MIEAVDLLVAAATTSREGGSEVVDERKSACVAEGAIVPVTLVDEEIRHILDFCKETERLDFPAVESARVQGLASAAERARARNAFPISHPKKISRSFVSFSLLHSFSLRCYHASRD